VSNDPTGRISRRDALRGAGLITGALAVASPAGAVRYAFHAPHQSGVVTPVQDHLILAAFDVTGSHPQLRETLRTWTTAAQRLVEGEPVASDRSPVYPPADTGETIGLGAAGLTLTFGFGPSLFTERLGLAQRRPRALIDLPHFAGDRLDPGRCGGDLVVQACANDPVVAFHAVRNLARLSEGTLALRWLQRGDGRTSSTSSREQTPRNLLGFKDGTANLDARDTEAMRRHVWVGESDQPWMSGGTYLVARRIRVRVEAWSALSLETQQAAIGRFRASGAPLSGRRERDPLRLDAYGPYGTPLIATNAHVRVASAKENHGAVILRRGFNFVDGLDPRTGELDAGLMFICYQNDPAHQFVTLQSRLSELDALSTYTVHTGSAIFACPPGVARGASLDDAVFG
jgi:deferrochelatase/peroxidase EfeB